MVEPSIFDRIRGMTLKQFQKCPERQQLTKDARKFIDKQKAKAEGIKLPKKHRRKRSVFTV